MPVNIGSLLADYDEWAKERTWFYRIPILLAIAVITYRMIFEDESHNSLFFGINLGVHEAGHLLTAFGPEIVCAAAGSIFQCLAPLIAIFILMKQESKFALPICLTWLASNIMYVSWYMNDAVEQEGVLLSVGGGEAKHDWLFIFTELGLYNQAQAIAGLVYVVGVLVALGSIALCCAMIYRMKTVSIPAESAVR